MTAGRLRRVSDEKLSTGKEYSRDVVAMASPMLVFCFVDVEELIGEEAAYPVNAAVE